MKELLRESIEQLPSVKASGGLNSYLAKQLTTLIETGEFHKDEVRLGAITELTKIAGYKDNPKITIITTGVPNLNNDQILKY